MATETAAAGQKEAEADGVILLFELENVVVHGRKKLYDLLKKNISAAGVQLTHGLFSQYGLKPTPEQSVASLVQNAGSGKVGAEKIGEDVNAAYVRDLREKVEPIGPIVKLLDTAAKKGFHLGALSSLAEEDAAALLQRIGLHVEIKLYAQKPGDAAFPRADGWGRLLKAVSKSSMPAAALVSSQIACKSALAAGLRVVVLPDEFTAHQDFGGADIVVDDVKDISVADILATLSVK